MSVIKVRGWHTSQKKMFSAETMAADQLTLLPTGSFINVHSDSTRLSEIYPKDIFIPLLYTGLNDTAEKEIYDKDILDGGFDRVGLVTWDDNDAQWVVLWQTTPLDRRRKATYYTKRLHQDILVSRVIGNIFENPDLLKKEVLNESSRS